MITHARIDTKLTPPDSTGSPPCAPPRSENSSTAAPSSTPVNDNYLFTLYSRPTPTQQRAFELLGIKPERTQ